MYFFHGASTRQQHRRTIDGRLCAAAFVQNRKTYTSCTDSPNPAGESGRPWCYVEAQVHEHVCDALGIAPSCISQVAGNECWWGGLELLRRARTQSVRWLAFSDLVVFAS